MTDACSSKVFMQVNAYPDKDNKYILQYKYTDYNIDHTVSKLLIDLHLINDLIIKMYCY